VLSLPDSFAAPKAFLGAMLLGAAPVPVSTQLSQADCAFILEDSGARALVTWEDSPAALAARDCANVGSVVLCALHGPWGLAEHSTEFVPVPPPPAAPGFDAL